MPRPEYEASPREVRQFAALQIALTAAFLVVIFFMLGATDAPFPALWVIGLMLVVVGVAGFLSERVWLSTPPLDSSADPAVNRRDAVGIFAGQTVRKLVYCEAAVVFCVLVTFVADRGGWPILVGGVPALLVLTWEIWPSLRNVSMTAAMLDARGASSGLVDSFVNP